MSNRIIKESICKSDEIDQLSWFEEVLFYRLIVNCDDFGRFDGREKVIKGYCFPLKDIAFSDITTAIQNLAAHGLLVKYEVKGKPVLQLSSWEKHQRIRNKVPKYPGPENADKCSSAICGELQQIAASCGESQQIAADCGELRQSAAQSNPIQSNTIQSESNPNTNQYKHSRVFTPPTVEEVDSYCRDRGNDIDAGEFVDFYQSKGWMIGKDKMKDWKAAVRTWERKRGFSPKKEHNSSPERERIDPNDMDTYKLRLLEGWSVSEDGFFWIPPV